MQAPVQNPQTHLLSEQTDHAYVRDMHVPSLGSLLAQEGLAIVDSGTENPDTLQQPANEFYSAFSFQDKPASLEKLREAYTNAQNSNLVHGKYSQAYDLLFAMISVDEESNAIILDEAAAEIDLATWRLDRNVIDDWEPASGVDEGAWVFLRGVSLVNLGPANPGGEHDYSRFIREYSKAQYRLRFGEGNISEAELDARVQNASDAIARSILEDILNIRDSGTDRRNPNPNHHLPNIHGIAIHDASAAAEELFTNQHIAGWAGNPFLLNVGHDESYRKNILHALEYEGDGDLFNTYDAMAVIRSMFDAAEAIGYDDTGALFFEILWDVVPKVSGAFSGVFVAGYDTNEFLNNAFGGSSTLFNIVFPSNIVVGTFGTGMRLVGTDGSDYIQGGNGDDVIIAFEEDDRTTSIRDSVTITGDDVLAGLGGNDSYTPGPGRDVVLDTEGIDTYFHGDAMGELRIRDIGGLGTLVWDDEVVASNDPELILAERIGTITFPGEEEHIFLITGENGTEFSAELAETLIGSDIRLIIERRNGYPFDRIVLENFEDGDFGIHLSDADTCLATASSSSKPGLEAPAFEALTPDGQRIALSDLRGQIVLIHFWGTWAGFAEKDMTLLQGLYAELGDNCFTILGMNLGENTQTIIDFQERLHITFPLLLDDAGTVETLYAVSVFPSSYLVGPDGTIIGEYLGFVSEQQIQEIRGFVASASP